MSKIIAALQERIKPKAPDVGPSLARRLQVMGRQFALRSAAGDGVGPAELDRVVRDIAEMVPLARAVDGGAPAENDVVLQACQLLFDAEGAFRAAYSDLRDRLHEAEPDPRGSILAALQVGQAFVAQAEALLAGGRMQS